MSGPEFDPNDFPEQKYNQTPEPVSDTEVSFFTLVKVVVAFLAVVYLITVLYEHSVVNNPYGAGTDAKPTGLESSVPSAGGDGGIKAVPWK